MASKPLSLIQKITQLAVQNFKRDSHRRNDAEFEQIKRLVSSLTVADLKIDSALLEDRGPYTYSQSNRDPAPVTYMQIYEDSDVTICVFILKNGVKLPLHDHPNMNGILKVIHGTVSIQSYTMRVPLHLDTPRTLGSNTLPDVYPALKHSRVSVSASDPICVLTPDSHNLHEISSVGGLAAFLDILSPPYGLDKRSGEERDCHYFQEVNMDLSQLREDHNYACLVSVPTPQEFWCDTADYQGPSVSEAAAMANGQ